MTLRSVKQNPDEGINGDVAVSTKHARSEAFANAAGQQVQREEFTIDSSNDNDEYAYTVDGEEISYTADSDTNAQVAQAIVDLHNANSFVRGITRAFVDPQDDNNVVIVGLDPGQSFPFEITTGTNLTYTNVQSAQDPQSLAPRKAVVLDSDDHPKLPEEADFTAKTLRVEVTASADGDYRIYMDVLGETFEAQYTASADNQVTIATELATSIEANSDYLSAAHVTDSGEFVEITPETDGFGAFTVTGTESPGEALVLTTVQEGDDIEELLQGLVVRSSRYAEQINAPANDNVVILQQGPMFTDTSEGVANGSQVFVEIRDSDTNGDLLTSHSDGAVPLSLETARWGEGQTVKINVIDRI